MVVEVRYLCGASIGSAQVLLRTHASSTAPDMALLNNDCKYANYFLPNYIHTVYNTKIF